MIANALLLTALFTQCLTQPFPEVVSVLKPGQETRIVDLIAPHTTDDLSLDGWTLVAMSPGPSCVVHFTFERGDDQVRFAYGPRSVGSEECAITVAGEDDVPDTLRRAFTALVESNAPQEVFGDTCLISKVEPSGDPDTEPVATSDAAPQAWMHTKIAAVILSLLTLLGLVILRGTKTSGIPTMTNRRDRVAFGLLLVAAAALRLFVAGHMAPADYELENFTADPLPWTFLEAIGSFVSPPPPQTYHGPLLDTFLRGWALIGDALGVGGELFWLRVPNLFLSFAMIWLLLRIGRVLGDPRTGWIAAGIFALSPLLGFLSVRQGPYFPEMVATTWFLERLLVSTATGRPVHRSLAVAGAVALWTGFLSALLVGPGLLLHAALTWRRGDHRRALGTIFLTVVLTAPVLGCGLANMLDMSAISIHGAVGADDNAALTAVYGHNSLEPGSTGPAGVLQMLLKLAVAVGGKVAGPLLLVLLFLHLALAPREGGPSMIMIIVFGILTAFLPLRVVNFTPVMPLVLVGSVRAAVLGAQRFLPPRIRVASLAALFVCVITGSLFTRPEVVWDSTPFAECLSGWIVHGDIQDVIDETLVPERRELTLVRGTLNSSNAYQLCPDRSRSSYAVACFDMASDADRPGLQRYQLGDREVWELRPDLDRGGCPSALGPDGPYAALQAPFLLAMDREFVQHLWEGSCPDPLDGRACGSIAAVREVELWRCEE